MRCVIVLTVVAGIAVGTSGWLDAAAQTEGEVPWNTLGKLNDSDMWRSVRRGEGGIIYTPDVRPQPLLDAPFNDCVKASNCTESAIGFTLPIHEEFPAILAAQGKGLGNDAIGLLAVLFAGSLIGGGLFLRRLDAEATDQG